MKESHYIEVKNLVKSYGTGDIKINAVDHVSFYVDKGEFIGIMGASGSGKTTILNILSTIDTMSVSYTHLSSSHQSPTTGGVSSLFLYISK